MFIFNLLRSTYNYCRVKLITLNLFDSQSTDPTKVYHEILSTRLFIVLFGASLIILTTYTSFSPQMTTEKIQSPSISDYERLQKQYSDTLQCLCSKISIPYYRFTNVDLSFHQVCSSYFISQEWIDFLFKNDGGNLWPMDVRTSLSAMWQLITILCAHSVKVFYNALFEFGVSFIISSTVLSEDRIQINIQEAVNEIQRTASNTFLLPLTTIQQITQINSFMTGTSINYGISEVSQPLELIESIQVIANKYLRKGTTTNCSCLNKVSCPMPGGIYLYDVWKTDGFFDLNTLVPNETLPGLVVDCLPLQTTFASSLECFYNQTCLNKLFSTYSTMINVEILDQSLSSRFPLKTNIESIVRELFIEKFQIQTNYNSYFDACAPVYCSYTRARRFDWIYVMTTLIALYGGLNAAFYIITPYLIDLLLFVKKKISRRDRFQQNEIVKIHILLWQWFHRLKVFIIELNLFDNYSDDPLDILRGRISTWLYIILLITIMTIITVFTMNTSYWATETIYSPSEKQYEDLYQQYPDTLQCPCTSISNPYGSFVRVTLRQHQICESNFVQPWWYQTLSSAENYNSTLNSSIFISSYFRTISMLCDITKSTLNDAIRQFSSTTFVSSHVRQKQFIVLQTDQLFSVLNSSAITEFDNIISLINGVLHTNQYISGRQTNVLLKKLFFNGSNQARIVPITNSGYDDNGQPCYCAQNPLCNIETHYRDSISWTIPELIQGIIDGNTFVSSYLLNWYWPLYNNSNETIVRAHAMTFNNSCSYGTLINWIQSEVIYSSALNSSHWMMPGLNIGCSIVDTMRHSTLQCLYNQTCVDLLQLFVQRNSDRLPNAINITALDSMLNTRYPPDTNILQMSYQSFFEEGLFEISYVDFYKQCAPNYCSYTYEKHNNYLIIISRILALWGGLTLSFGYLAPCIVRMWFTINTYRHSNRVYAVA
ncbi:unnamed protein product [Rotaria sp. Silwood1]|nr:unnamed protein product [Rotaria sp. Silwood1]CAF3575495.1 unnamed protein product [Rotaria sp. Silwood1]